MAHAQPVALYITDESDPAIEPVQAELASRDVAVRLLQRNSYGSDWSLSWSSDRRGVRCILEHSAGDLLADQAIAAFVRRDFTGPLLQVGRDVDEVGYIELQTAIHVNSVYRWLSSKIPFMNDPLANLRMMSKTLQQDIALQCGFEVPDTFAGSSPEFANQFQGATEAELCIKPIEATRVRLADGKRAAHLTKKFERRPLAGLATLRACPAVLQHFVAKHDELRVTVVGDQVLACRIDTTFASPDAQVDFRHYDWANTPHEATELDEQTAGKLRKFMARSALVYGAFDLIRAKDGRIVFLEVNPMGQWLWVEELTGLPITRAIANWLSSPT